MAVDFQERETLLFPSQLLTDDDALWEKQNINHHDLSADHESNFSGFGSCGSSSSSDLSTPVGPEMDSTEKEIDEDDFIAELTRQMADYMLQEDDENAKWSDCNSGSKYYHDQRLKGTSLKPTSVLAHAIKPSSSGFYSNEAFTHDRLQHIKFDQLRNQQHMKNEGSGEWGRRAKLTESTQHIEPEQQIQRQKYYQRMQNKGRGGELDNGGRFHPLGSSRTGSGMRAIFLGGSGSRNASSGTGVFLPRGTYNSPETRKKPAGCSTVLIPARVLQTLKLHFNNMQDVMSPSNGYPNQHDDVLLVGGLNKSKKPQLQSEMRSSMKHQELQLPQEWTY